MRLKYLIIFLPFVAVAQVAVKFYSEEPTNHQNRILGIPTNMISQVIWTNSAPAGFVLMTEQQFKDHSDAVRPAFREWLTNVYEPYWATNSQPSPTVVSNRQANVQALKALVDQMENAETNWAAITDAQVKGLVRVHNQALLRLKPLIQELYRDYLAKE